MPSKKAIAKVMRRESVKPDDTYSIWDNPNCMFESEYGRVTYKKWCNKEIERLAKKDFFVEIKTAPDGDIALREIGKE